MPQPQNINLNMLIDQVAKERGLSREVFIDTLEQAILQTAKKTFGAERKLEAKYDSDKGQVELFQPITIVENYSDPSQMVNEFLIEDARARGLDVSVGDELLFQIFYLDIDAAEAQAQDEQYGDILRLKTSRQLFGRIAAQTVRQVMLQRTRDAEREVVFNKYADRKNELVSGTIRRLERNNIIVDLGEAEAVLPNREQAPRENYRVGDRLEAYVMDVQRDAKGPQIILSRTSSKLLVKLFEREVPEIAEGVVVIEASARDPGVRSKIAVSTTDEDVDPIGACVGMRGSRVQAVVQELHGERIDIVPWDEDAATFVCNALAPAEVSRVLIDETNHTMDIIVPDDQLSLAIGRRGQNVRLAAQLTGWKLDINSESRVKEIHDFAVMSLSALPHMDETLVEMLYKHGLRQADDVLKAQAGLLALIPGIRPEWIDEMKAAAKIQREKDVQELTRRRDAQEAKRIAELSKHPDDLTPEERMRRVKGMDAKCYEALAKAGYTTIESLQPEVSDEKKAVRLASKVGISPKKAKSLKHSIEVYLKDEAKLRDRLNAERAAVEK